MYDSRTQNIFLAIDHKSNEMRLLQFTLKIILCSSNKTFFTSDNIVLSISTRQEFYLSKSVCSSDDNVPSPSSSDQQDSSVK